MMSIAGLRPLIFALGVIFSPFFSHGAVNCVPDGKKLEELNPISLYQATKELTKRVFVTITAEGDWKTCTRELSLAARRLAQDVESQAPAGLSNELGQAYVTLIMTSEAQLLSLRIRAALPRLPDLVMSFTTQDYLRFFPLTFANVPGTTGEVRGQQTRLYLNGETEFMGHLNGMSKARSSDQAKQYFDTSRCLLSRLFIEKAEAHAILGGRTTDIHLSGLRACDGLNLSKLVDRSMTIDYDKRLESLLENLKKSETYLSDSNKTEIATIAKDAKVEIPVLMIQSVLKGNTTPESTRVNSILGQAEAQLLGSDDIARDLVNIGLQMRAARDQALAQNKIKAQLTKYNDLYTRKALADIVGEIAYSSALALTSKESDLSANLNETLTYLILNNIEYATKSELTFDGHLSTKDAESFSLLKNPGLANRIRQLVVSARTADKVKARLTIRKTLLLEKQLPDLVLFSKELQKITDPKTDFKDLEFNVYSVTRLFDGNIESLPPEFRFYIDQILSRKTHADRAKIWPRLQAVLLADAKKHGYECEKPTIAQRAGSVGRYVFRVQADPLYTRSQNCVFVNRYADYLGLNRTCAPEKISDIYWALKEYNSSGDLKRFNTLYRANLKNFRVDKNRILDMPLEKLGQKSDQFLYDVIANSADPATLPRPTTEVKMPDCTTPAPVASTTPAPVRPEEEAPVPALLKDKADSVYSLLDKAIRYAQNQNEVDAMKVIHAQKIEDLELFILETNLLEQLLGAPSIEAYRPGLAANQEMSPAFPSVYNYHTNYKDTLFRRKGLTRTLKENFMSNMTVPFIYLGAAWGLRELTVRTVGKSIGMTLADAAASTRIVTQGLSHMLTYAFTASFVDYAFWHQDIRQAIELVDSLKLGDVIIDGEIALIDYNHYMFRRTGLDLDRKKARNRMIYDGFFAILSPVVNLLEPAAASGLVEFKRLNKVSSWYSSLWNQAKGARVDKLRLRPSLKRLGLTGEHVDVITLQTARSRMLAQNPANEMIIEEAYKRVIHTLGLRAQQALSNKDKAKAVAKELYGSESYVSELHRIASEYNRLFPDLIRGGL